MKKNKLLAFFLVVASVSSIQSQINIQKASENSIELGSSDAKSKFIKNQDYLSLNSLSEFKNYYGDSLKGFDESAIKADLLTRGVYGSEYTNFIKTFKRQYIDNKYKLGAKYAPAPTPQNIINNGASHKGSGGNIINVAPCVNEDFELSPVGVCTGANAVVGWTIASQMNPTTVYSPNINYGAGCNANPMGNGPAWFAGSAECWIVSTPVLGVPFIGTLPNSPLGGTKVIKLQDQYPTGLMTRIRSTFPVTQANTLLQFAYAGSWDGVHDCCGQPSFRVDLIACTGSVLPCSTVSLTPSGAQCQSGVPGYSVTNGVSWVNWVVKYIDLTPYIGTCVTLQITDADCSYTGHHGSAYFDARCGGQGLIGTGIGGGGGNIAGPVSFCAGANQAVIAAPAGYSSYQWISPLTGTIPANAGGTAPTITITPVVAGLVYTVQLNTPAGCSYVATNTILPTIVNIAGVGSGSTCPGGSSGTGSVVGNGSGTGYNYTWLNSNSVTVGTASTVSNLAPGIYSIVLTGFGAAGCGSAVATTTVGTAPQAVINLLKPYCGSEAYLNTNGGSLFRWYNNNTLITGTVGAQPNYTVTSPCNNCIYRLAYLSSQGCQDSIIFTLLSSPPGLMNVSNISLVCPGGNNGTAVVSMTPATGSPPGANSYSIFSIGLTPSYNASLSPTSLSAFTSTGLAAGVYSINTFDGSCKYGTSFNVYALTYNYTVSPLTQTLCTGSQIAASITFSVPPSLTQYSYSWSPATFLAGNTQQFTIISPTTALGTVTNIIYTVVVTPTLANCPVTKTISIVVANPAVPVFNTIVPFCNTSPSPTIIATPPGGTFVTSNPQVLGSVNGIISPTSAAIGVNTFTYTYAIFTCVATSSGSFQVSQFNTAALTGTVPNLCVTSNAFNLMNIIQSSVSGVWSAPTAPGAIIGNIFNPAGLSTNNYIAYYNTTSFPNPTVCPASSPLLISVTNTIIPYITQVPQFCNTQGAISMTVSNPGGLWSGNGVSSLGVISPSLLSAGTQVVLYTIPIGPCVNTNTTNLYVSVFNSAALSGTVQNLCVTNNPVNLMNILQSTVNAIWSGTNVQNNILTPTGLPTNIYNYTVNTTSTPNPTLCPDSQTIAVSVLNPPSPFITLVGPFCNNASSIQLTVTPNTGSWTPSSYLSNTGVFTPSLSSIGNNVVQYVIGTNTCSNEQSKQISIEAYVSSAIVNPIPDQCITSSPVNLLPMTLSSSGVWNGPGISGTNFIPSVSGAGNFVLTFNTASYPSGLCPNQSTVAVNVFSLALPAITKIGPFCNSHSPKQLIVVPLGGFFGGSNSSNAITSSGLFNPGAAIVGDNIITYSISAGPCVAYAQTTVSIEKFISADFEKYAGPYCNTNYPVNMNSFVHNPGGTWSGLSMVGSMFSPAQAISGNNNLILYQTHSLPTASLCPDTSLIRIRVNNMPNLIVSSNINKGCAPLEITFTANNINDGIGNWNFGDGSVTKTGFTIKHVYPSAGTYSIMFNYVDEEGVCSTNTQVATAINVYAMPKASFYTPEEISISTPELQLNNLSTVLGDNKYLWKISNFYQSTDISPKVVFTKIGRYEIVLAATTLNGCKDEVSRFIEIKNDFNIYVPTSFSPNFDRLNDEFKAVFTPFGLDSKNYEMDIYDRWGHLLFNTNDPNKGWDGSFQNKGGDVLKEDVYVYKIKYKDMEGVIYNKMGHLSLIK